MSVLAIDPGNVESAFMLYEDGKPVPNSRGWQDQAFGKLPNAAMLDLVRTKARHGSKTLRLVIEMIASYGMPVGREVFDTCVWIGRFVEAWNYERMPAACAQLLYRRDVKLHLCGLARAKDGNVRQALIDRYGGKDKAIGKKAAPGPLYGVTADVWSALAVAVTFDALRVGQVTGEQFECATSANGGLERHVESSQ